MITLFATSLKLLVILRWYSPTTMLLAKFSKDEANGMHLYCKAKKNGKYRRCRIMVIMPVRLLLMMMCEVRTQRIAKIMVRRSYLWNCNLQAHVTKATTTLTNIKAVKAHPDPRSKLKLIMAPLRTFAALFLAANSASAFAPSTSAVTKVSRYEN